MLQNTYLNWKKKKRWCIPQPGRGAFSIDDCTTIRSRIVIITSFNYYYKSTVAIRTIRANSWTKKCNPLSRSILHHDVVSSRIYWLWKYVADRNETICFFPCLFLDKFSFRTDSDERLPDLLHTISTLTVSQEEGRKRPFQKSPSLSGVCMMRSQTPPSPLPSL